MKISRDRCLLLAAFVVAFALALNSRVALAQKSAGAGSHAMAPAQSAQAAPTDPSPPSPKNGPAPTPASVPQKTTLADFAWLEGRWQGTWGPRLAEQTWSAPNAGMMLGTFRLVENEKTLVIEMFTLVEKPDGINLYIRHFTPDLVPWEKSDATVLNFVNLDGGRATFENPVNGQPKRSIFIRTDADAFISRSEIVPSEGDLQVIEITYHHLKPAPAPPASGGNASHR